MPIISTIDLFYLSLLAATSVFGAWSIRHWADVTAMYNRQPYRVQIVLIVVPGFILMTLLMLNLPGRW